MTPGKDQTAPPAALEHTAAPAAEKLRAILHERKRKRQLAEAARSTSSGTQAPPTASVASAAPSAAPTLALVPASEPSPARKKIRHNEPTSSETSIVHSLPPAPDFKTSLAEAKRLAPQLGHLSIQDDGTVTGLHVTELLSLLQNLDLTPGSIQHAETTCKEQEQRGKKRRLDEDGAVPEQLDEDRSVQENPDCLDDTIEGYQVYVAKPAPRAAWAGVLGRNPTALSPAGSVELQATQEEVQPSLAAYLKATMRMPPLLRVDPALLNAALTPGGKNGHTRSGHGQMLANHGAVAFHGDNLLSLTVGLATEAIYPGFSCGAQSLLRDIHEANATQRLIAIGLGLHKKMCLGNAGKRAKEAVWQAEHSLGLVLEGFFLAILLTHGIEVTLAYSTLCFGQSLEYIYDMMATDAVSESSDSREWREAISGAGMFDVLKWLEGVTSLGVKVETHDGRVTVRIWCQWGQELLRGMAEHGSVDVARGLASLQIIRQMYTLVPQTWRDLM
ncbi:uncharacterized protein LOC62_01G000875 [Vanrija pseudolonga]|uniref:RNase III domain-containing protein n=1 Tax=Vanrija pseudolonga TaxID=143232 RepID=A0AAF0Y055_9TREE|nr:hypothetical protein LOC62_01G000875 [Vanrija pseudolonga]